MTSASFVPNSIGRGPCGPLKQRGRPFKKAGAPYFSRSLFSWFCYQKISIRISMRWADICHGFKSCFTALHLRLLARVSRARRLFSPAFNKVLPDSLKLGRRGGDLFSRRAKKNSLLLDPAAIIWSSRARGAGPVPRGPSQVFLVWGGFSFFFFLF